MRIPLQALSAFTALCFTPAQATAQNIIYELTGTVSSLILPPSSGSVWTGIAISDPVTLTVTVDPTAAGVPSLPQVTAYPGAILDTTLTVGSITVSNPGGLVEVWNDRPVLGCTDLVRLAPASSLGWDLDAPVAQLLSSLVACPNPDYVSDALPLAFPAGATFPISDFIGDASSGGAFFEVSYTAGTVTPPAPPAPPNDDCANAIALPGFFTTTAYDASNATTDGADAMGFCDYGEFGDEQNYNDIWFTFTPQIGGCTYISTYNLAGYDTRLTVYDGHACPDDPANILACADDEELPTMAPFEAGLDVSLTAGETYTIRLGTFESTTTPGPGSISISAGPGADVLSGGMNPGAPGCPENFTFEIGSATVQPGGTVTLPVTMDALIGPIQRIGLSVTVPPSLSVLSWEPSPFILTSNGGSAPSLAAYDILSGGVTASIVVNFLGGNTIAAGPDIELGLLTLEVPGNDPVGTQYTLDFTPLGMPPVETDALVGGMAFGGNEINGTIEIDYRSLCNGDGGDQMGCTDCPCGNNATAGTIGGCAHSASGMFGGAGSRLIVDGSPSVSLPFDSTEDLRLSMENMPPTSTAVMFSGSAVAPQNVMNPCFGNGVAVDLMSAGAKDGLRCAVGGLIRHGNRQSNSLGDIKDNSGPSRTWGGTAGPPAGLAVQVGFTAGQTRYFQATHREIDTAICMTGLNTSQAVEVTFTP